MMALARLQGCWWGVMDGRTHLHPAEGGLIWGVWMVLLNKWEQLLCSVCDSIGNLCFQIDQSVAAAVVLQADSKESLSGSPCDQKQDQLRWGQLEPKEMTLAGPWIALLVMLPGCSRVSTKMPGSWPAHDFPRDQCRRDHFHFHLHPYFVVSEQRRPGGNGMNMAEHTSGSRRR